jgi:hypothetical protein
MLVFVLTGTLYRETITIHSSSIVELFQSRSKSSKIGGHAVWDGIRETDSYQQGNSTVAS